MSREQVIKFCKEAHQAGWMPGASGAVVTLEVVNNNSKKILATPSLIRKEDIQSNDLFELRDLYGTQEMIPPMERAGRTYRLPKRSNLYLEVLTRNADIRCVVEVHSTWTILAAKDAEKQSFGRGNSLPNILRLAYWGLLRDSDQVELKIPTLCLPEDTDSALQSFKNLLDRYPESQALVIRDCGVIVWGSSLTDVKNKIETIESLSKLEVLNNRWVNS